MKMLLTGATGLVGAEVLLQLLNDPAILGVTAISRRPLAIGHPKLTELVLEDFTDYSRVDLSGHDACIWCLGVSSRNVGRDEYVKITVDYALAAAKALFHANPKAKFCFLSGRGADPSESSLPFFSKIKGRAERKLSELSQNVISFRPGYVQPSTPREKSRLTERVLNSLVPTINTLTEHFSVTSHQLARCLIGVAKVGSSMSLMDNADIRRWKGPRVVATREPLTASRL